MRGMPDDGYSEADDLKFGWGFILLVLFTVGSVVLAVLGLLL